MKVLFASRSIYPCYKGGSSFVMESLAQNFGKEEMVVAGGMHFLGEPQKERPADMPDFYYLPTEIHIKGRGHKYFNQLRWIFLFPFLVFSLYRIAKREKCSHIVGVFPDNFYLFGAYLTSKLLKLPFSSYFHNTYLENRTGFSKRWAKYVQGKVFKHSKDVFLMSEGMLWYYQKQYPGISFKVLVHTFNEYPDSKVESQPTDRPCQLVLIGNFNHSNLDATRFLVDALKNEEGFEVNVCTKVKKEVLAAKGVDTDAIRYHGYVPDEKLFQVLQEHDISVITHGFGGELDSIEYQTIFPTRTIPLLLSGNPLLVLSPPKVFLSSFIEKYDCGEVLTNKDKAVLMKKLNAIVSDQERFQTLVKNGTKIVKNFYGPNVAQSLKERLN